MRTVDALTPADRGTVWRCPAFTVAWIEDSKTVATRTGTTRIAAWCRLDWHTWIPLDPMPSGPFYELGTLDEIENCSDYRDSLPQYHGGQR
jgi:hypothetical protein